jgi:FeS assembly SUF system regulator
MLRITKLTDYAIIILGQMAKYPEGIYNATDLAQLTGVATPTVSKVLKALTRAEILLSTRGPKGGYQLATTPENLTVANIIHVMEGPIAITECSLEQLSCDQSLSCHARGNWSILNNAIQAALESVSLADMFHPMLQVPEGFRIPLSSISVQPKRFKE